MNMHSFIFRLMAGLLFIPHFAHCEARDESDLFRRQCVALAQNAEKTSSMTVAGKDNWFFLAAELRHLGAGQFWGEAAARISRATGPDIADPLPAILDFYDQLKKIGVELIVVPVPPKAVIYPDMLPGFTRLRQDAQRLPALPIGFAETRGTGTNGEPTAAESCEAGRSRVSGYAAVPPGSTNKNATTRLDRFHQEFYALLRSKGVKVLDLTDFFLHDKNPFQGQGRGPLYCRQDSHWSGNGCVLAAGKIAAEVRPILGDSGRPTNAFKSDWMTIEINGDLRQALKNTEIPREKLLIRKISKPGGDEPVEPTAESAIILLGDSHNIVFHAGEDMLCHGAGLPDQLAFELGEKVDLVAVRGSGATPARINLMRRAQQKNNYWTNKKCVIWCFSAREFTESDGWRKIPVVPKK